jgi:hypothetical protein
VKDNKLLLLLLLSAGLVITWVYHLYDKSQYANQTKEILVKDSSAVAKAVSDSLREFFTNTLNQLGNDKLVVDSGSTVLNGELEQKVTEINVLKQDISDILKRKNLTQADLTEAKIKIDDLKLKLAGLKTEDTKLTNEGKRLDGVITQLTSEINTKQETGTDNKQIPKKNENSVFIASDIRFAAFSTQPDKKETETTQQGNANKFVSSFIVRNNTVGFQDAEIIVVVSDPSGKSVNPEVWDAGSFVTKNEGRKVYSRKMKFEYNKGETKRLNFSLEPDSFEKGIYKLSLYHNGVRIGGSTWKLS